MWIYRQWLIIIEPSQCKKDKKNMDNTLEDGLKCPGCKRLFYRPSLLMPCRHTLCKSCCDVQTQNGHICCIVCGNLVKSRDIRMDFNKQRELDAYKSKMQEKHSKRIKAVYQDMLHHRMTLENEIRKFEGCEGRLRSMEYSLMKQIDKSELELIRAIRERHQALRMGVKERTETERNRFMENKRNFRAIKDDVADRLKILKNLMTSPNTDGTDINETLYESNRFLQEGAKQHLIQFKESLPELHIQFTPILEPARLLDDLRLRKGKTTPVHLFMATNTATGSDIGDSYGNDVITKGGSQFEDMQAENIWHPDEELYREAKNQLSFRNILAQSVTDDVFTEGAHALSESTHALSESAHALCESAHTLNERTRVLSPMLSEVDIQRACDQNLLNEKVAILQETNNEEMNQLINIEKQFTSFVDVPLDSEKLFDIPGGVTEMEVINNEIWFLMKSGYILKGSTWTDSSDRINLILHLGDVKITYLISSVAQTPNGHIILACSGFNASRNIDTCACLAIQEIDASGNIINSIDNDRYVSDIKCCEESLFALSAEGIRPGSVRWFRFDGEEWQHMTDVNISQSLSANAVLAFDAYLYISCPKTNAIYSVDLSTCAVGDDSDLCPIILEESDLVFKLGQGQVNPKLRFVTHCGHVKITCSHQTSSASERQNGGGSVSINGGSLSIMKQHVDQKCRFYTMAGMNANGIVMRDGEILVAANDQKVYKLKTK